MSQVLIIDASVPFAAVCGHLLRRAGHEPICCASLEEALARVDPSTVRVAILTLPLVHERDLAELRRLCRDPAWATVSVVTLCTVNNTSLMDRARAIGAAAVLLKGSFSMKELAQMVEVQMAA